MTVTTSGFFAKPIKQAYTTSGISLLEYDSASGEFMYTGTVPVPITRNKTFIVDHPTDINKYLVHACLEGPEAGVYYRGKGEIENNKSTTILLPDYVDALACEFTVHITPIFNSKTSNKYNAGTISNNQFTVYGENGKFFWIVYGKRSQIQVEPLKSNVVIKGDGPYKWIHF